MSSKLYRNLIALRIIFSSSLKYWQANIRNERVFIGNSIIGTEGKVKKKKKLSSFCACFRVPREDNL